MLARLLFMDRYPTLDPSDDRAYSRGTVVRMDHPGAEGDEELAYRMSVVWRGLNVLAAAVSVLPLNVYRRLPDGGKEPARDLPEHQIMRLQPNRAQTSFRWRHHLMMHAVGAGNYYAQILRDGNGVFTGVWPLDRQRMEVTGVQPDGSLAYRYTTRAGQPQPLRQDQVLHIRGASHDGLVGVSVLDLMRQHVAQGLASQRQRTAFLRNEMRPSVVFKHPGEMSPEAQARWKEQTRQTYGGPDNAGNYLILEEGMDIAPFQISSRDAQFIENEKFRVEEFLRFIGVPGVLCGYADKTATYASAEAFFQSFKDHNVFPWTRNIEQELTVALLGIQDELFFEFNLDALLRPDSTARAQFYRAMIELGILTRNEVRQLENRNPLPGLDKPLTPRNMSQGNENGQAGNRKPSAPDPQDDQREDDQDEKQQEEGDSSDALAALPSRVARILDEAAASVVRTEVRAFAGGGGRKGAAVRYAGDTAGWTRFVEEFYASHWRVVYERLGLPESVARAYCEQQAQELLTRGVSVCEEWSRTGAAALVCLALQEETDAA